jgi:hypothetical protein
MERNMNTTGSTCARKHAAVRNIAGLVLAAGLALLVSCMPPGLAQTPGTLSIEIAAAGMDGRTLLPNIDMTIASYVVTGTGPGSQTFSTTVTGTSATIPGLATGSWTVDVDGKNAGGTFVGHGESTVQVSAGTTQTASVSVDPIVGNGTLSLSVSWPAASVAQPAIAAQLIPATGSATTLAFTAPASGSSTYTNSALANGYYTLVLQLTDGGQPVMGAVEVVRIVKGQTTSGSFAFSSVNTARGSVAVSITPNMRNPIAVTLSGQAATVATGTAMTVNASVPSGTGNTTCVWYLNGASFATGTSVTLNGAASPMAPGSYRLDAVVFTANGLRAGSANAVFTVAAVAPVSSVTLVWDANTETDIAGYKMYVGTASGTYAAPVDVGKVTTYCVTNLVSGTTYYFAVTAYNTSGMESPKSAEISKVAP